MSQIIIGTDAVKSISGVLKQNHTQVSEIADDLFFLRNTVDHRILARRNINSRMASALSYSNVLEQRMKRFIQFVFRSVDSYTQTEDLLVKKASTNSSMSPKIHLNTTLKFIEEASLIGPILAFFLRPVANWVDYGVFDLSKEVGAVRVAEVLKVGHSALKGVWKWQKSDQGLDKLARMLPKRATITNIKRLIGLDDIFSGTASEVGGGLTRCYNNFQKLKLNAISNYTEGGAKAAFAWSGVALSGILNACKNYEESKNSEISGKRAVAETITETALDMVKGFVIGAGAAVVIGATFGAAPVIAVGAVTVGVTVGLDSISKKFTGKEFTELASDTLLDVGEAGLDAGKKFLQQAFNKATNCFVNPHSTTTVQWGTQLGY